MAVDRVMTELPQQREAGEASGAGGQAPEIPPTAILAATSEEEAEVLQSSIRAASMAQLVVAGVAVLALIYLLKLVMVTALTSMLIAFTLEPLVAQSCRLHLPRWLGALIAVVLMVALALGLSYFFYSRAVDFATELPKYSGKIRNAIVKLRKQTSSIEESTRAVMGQDGKPPVPVEVKESVGLSHFFSAGIGAFGDTLLAVTFVPFLAFFMLTWKEHAHKATVRLFPKEHRVVAHRTVSRISAVIRTFISGNVAVGILNAAISTAVFWYVGIPYFYFVGVISGFISLVPYLGVFLALLPPLAGGIGVMNKASLLIVVLTVIGLHVITMNVLYPKLVGKRLRLNPLAVTLGLLFWAWIWGAMGLILAVPMLGATKAVCDHIEPLQSLGYWLGE